MTEKLLDLSGKIDESTITIYETILRVANSFDIPFFIVGANARDMILEYGYGVGIQRATIDIDIGVEVSKWEQFQLLSEGLIETGHFTKSEQRQRLLHKTNIPVDIIPFGLIEDDNKQISWPPDHEIRLNVLGFDEAYRDAQIVRIRSDPVLDINVVTLPWLAVLKLISWRDRHPKGKKDAKDLDYIMNYYLQAGNMERLFNDNSDLLEEEDFDFHISNARLLGRDIAKIGNPDTLEEVLKILEKETKESEGHHLVTNMMDFPNTEENDFEKKLRLLNALKQGIVEGKS